MVIKNVEMVAMSDDVRIIGTAIQFSKSHFFEKLSQFCDRAFRPEEQERILILVRDELGKSVREHLDRSTVLVIIDLRRPLRITGKIAVSLIAPCSFAVVDGRCELDVFPVDETGDVIIRPNDTTRFGSLMYGSFTFKDEELRIVPFGRSKG